MNQWLNEDPLVHISFLAQLLIHIVSVKSATVHKEHFVSIMTFCTTTQQDNWFLEDQLLSTWKLLLFCYSFLNFSIGCWDFQIFFVIVLDYCFVKGIGNNMNRMLGIRELDWRSSDISFSEVPEKPCLFLLWTIFIFIFKFCFSF